MLGRGIEHHADLPSRVGQVPEPATRDGDASRVGPGQADHHPHRGRLAGPVGAQEAGHAACPGGEGDVVHDGAAAVLLRQ